MSEQEPKQMTRDDKLAKWGPGPWIDEPDHVEWRYEGMPCLMRRNSAGAWCGYVGVEPGHPWHGLNYSDRVPLTPEMRDRELGGGERAVNWIGLFCHAAGEDDGKIALDLAVNVHGGLTYADKCQDAICHVPQPGEPDDVWWLGFDCHHSGDAAPPRVDVPADKRWIYAPCSGAVYRDAEYVRGEVEHLAAQVIAARTSE